jgi:hypothetical protein
VVIEQVRKCIMKDAPSSQLTTPHHFRLPSCCTRPSLSEALRPPTSLEDVCKGGLLSHVHELQACRQQMGPSTSAKTGWLGWTAGLAAGSRSTG